jgi:hypothetical protein
MDRLTCTIPHQIPPFKKGSHRELTLREAARLQSPAEHIQVRWRCKGNCTTVRCKCFKAKAECTLHCHGRGGGAQCINTGPSAAPSGTFNLERNIGNPLSPAPESARWWSGQCGLVILYIERTISLLDFLIAPATISNTKHKISSTDGAQCNCSCIRTSKRHPIVGITMMYRLFIIFH